MWNFIMFHMRRYREQSGTTSYATKRTGSVKAASAKKDKKKGETARLSLVILCQKVIVIRVETSYV